jgi:hypothetical protein
MVRHEESRKAQHRKKQFEKRRERTEKDTDSVLVCELDSSDDPRPSSLEDLEGKVEVRTIQ